MNYYYGLVDTENNGWGFVEEGDARITDDFIELTEEEWNELLNGHTEGKAIVGYGGKCFLADEYKYYVDDNGVWQERTDEEAAEVEAAEEAKRKAYLTLTATDVERIIYKDKGMDFDDIVEAIEALNEDGTTDIDVKALKIELKANNFYRGNEYVEQVGTLLGYTSEDLDYLFEYGELPSSEDEETGDTDDAADSTDESTTTDETTTEQE